MRRVTGDAAFAGRFVFEDKRASLGGVALEASLVFAQESHAAALDRLGETRPAAFDRRSFMRIMTIDTAHFSFQHRMVVGQHELRPNLKVTLETGVG